MSVCHVLMFLSAILLPEHLCVFVCVCVRGIWHKASCICDTPFPFHFKLVTLTSSVFISLSWLSSLRDGKMLQFVCFTHTHTHAHTHTNKYLLEFFFFETWTCLRPLSCSWSGYVKVCCFNSVACCILWFVTSSCVGQKNKTVALHLGNPWKEDKKDLR